MSYNVSTAFTREELAYIADPQNGIAVLLGNNSAFDIRPHIYTFNGNSIAEDDGLDIIKVLDAQWTGHSVWELRYVLTPEPTINNNVSRSLDSSFLISSGKRTHVTYTIRISFSATLVIGSSGVATLQYSIDNGSNWISVSSVSSIINSGLVLSGSNDFNLTGDIPNTATNIRIATTATNSTISYIAGQEVIFNDLP